MKKTISLIVVLSMLLSIFGAMPLSVSAATVGEGACGTSLTWVLDSEGTLTISGTGEMGNGNSSWSNYKDSIKKVVIGEGVTSVSYDSFWNYDNITAVEISSTVTTIGGWAFSSCDALKEVTIPPSVEIIDYMAFYGVSTIKGYKYSAAHTYAVDGGFEFVSLGELPEEVIREGNCGEGVTYSLTNRGVLTISGKGEIAAYEYQESPWSKYMFSITSVVIKEGITAIGDGAFNGNIKVKNLTIPEGVTYIGNMAFYGCNYIEELDLPSSLLAIGDNAFDSTGITELVIPEGVTTIGAEAFVTAPITMVTIPESVTFIGDNAFGGGETEPVIKGVKGSYAETWAGNNHIKFAPVFTEPVQGSWGDNITWVLDTDGTLTITGEGEMQHGNTADAYPWYEYSSLITSIVIGDDVTYISWCAFEYCSNITSVTISYKVKHVEYNAFYFAPESLVIKGYNNSYAENYALTYSYTFESLGDMPRYEVASGTCGTSVTYSIDNYGLLKISGTGKIENYSGWSSQKSSVKEIVISEGVTAICNYAFDGCYSVEKVTIPETMTNIGVRSFGYCSELPEVTVPASVAVIGTSAFFSCGNNCDTAFVIKGYTPSAAKEYAENNSVAFVSLGTAPVAVIASGKCGTNITWTLDNYGLLKLTGSGAMSYSAGGNVAGGEVGADVMLMAQSYEVPWYDYRSQIKAVEIAEGITTIEDYAFYFCETLTEVELPESITSIGKYAFYGCDVLTKVSIHYNVDEIADSAFGYSDNLVIYGYAGSAAEEAASYHGIGFVSLGEAPLRVVDQGFVTDTITWSLDSQGRLTITGTGDMPDYYYSSERPWENYKNRIKSVEINGVDTVGEYSFVRYTSLGSVVMNNVKAINSCAFYDCSNVTEVTLPVALTSAKNNSFNNMYDFTIKGFEGTYAQMYAEYLGYNFEALEGGIEVKTVYVSSIEELIAAIGSNTEIIVRDGVYLLDRTSYLGDLQYTWEYADIIKIENVINLTIKAENPGNVEILSLQRYPLSYNQYEQAPFYIAGAYNLIIEGIRFGNMNMSANNGSRPTEDDVILMGGYDEYALNGYSGAYITNSSNNNGGYNSVPLRNKVTFRNCDIFNCTYAVTFYGASLVIDNCTLRNNVKGAIASTADDVVIKDSVISRNGSSERYRGTYCLDVTKANVTNTMFINNGNEAYASGTINGTGSTFSNNNWDGEAQKAYGVTKNGITWSVTELKGENILKLGYTINADNITIESQTGEVYPYTVDSLPWKAFDIDNVDVNDGVTYSYTENGSCGETVVWSYDKNTKTLTLSGKGNMSNMGYIDEWYENEIENIVIANTITGIYNLFNGTKYAQNDANWENGLLYIGDVLVRAKEDVEGKVTVKNGTRVIAEEAFASCRNITEIVLPESVIAMGVTEKLNVGEYTQNGVFSYCTALEKLTIPATVTDFDHALVYGCDNLRSIYYSGTMAQWEEIAVGKNNEQLGYCTIYAADGTIKPATLYYTINGASVTVTGVDPFATEVVIPLEIEGLPVTEIAVDLFVEHKNVVSVTIEANVDSAPYFTNSTSLENVVLGDGIQYVSYGIFEGCEKLASITLGDNIAEMSGRAFEDTAYYKNAANRDGGILYVDGYAAALSDTAAGKVTVRSDARGICYDTFNNNSTVTEIVIPDGVKMQNLGEGFYNMSALESITLPDVFVAPDYGFGVYDCEKLANVNISENHPSLVSIDGVVFTKDKQTLVYMPMGRSGSYTIPETVTVIGGNSFMNTHISALTIPGSVNTIADRAFPFSYYLKDVYYNITVADWEDWDKIYVGGGNGALDAVSLHLLDYEFIAEDIDYRLSPDGSYYIVVGLKDYVTEVTIPATYGSLPVKEVDSYAFMNKVKLTKINAQESSAYFTSVDGVLYTKDMRTLVAYPAGKADESFTLPEGVKAIASEAFAFSKNLTAIDLGDTLTDIGAWAFESSGIKSVTIPETVTVLVSGVFSTDSLEKVSFGTHIRSIANNTFAYELKYIYFDGTLNDWRSVTGSYNIGPNTEVITKVEIVEADAELYEEEIVVNFYIDGADYDQKVFAIGLDGDGTQITYDEVSGEYVYAGYLAIEDDVDKLNKVEQVKLFVWESIESMRPLSEPVIVEVRK